MSKEAKKPQTEAAAPEQKISEKAAPKPMFDITALKVVKNVTLPLLKLQDEKPEGIVVKSKIYVGKEIVQKKGETEMKPAELIKIIDLTSGREAEMIINSVLKSTFEENYEKDGYVGKAFLVTRHAKAAGKRYNTFSVTEIENPIK